MIVSIFYFFLVLGVLAIALGYFLDQPHFLLVGLTFLFLIGLALMSGSVEYKTGEVINTTYLNSTNPNVIQVAYTNSTYHYVPISDYYSRTIGFLLTVSSGFGLGLTLLRLRELKGGFV